MNTTTTRTRQRGLVGGLAMLAVLTLGACASTSGGAGGGDAGEPVELAGDWQLVSGSDAEGQFDIGGATITLSFDENGAGGTAACNSYGATVTQDNGTIGFSEIFQTEMACTEPGIMELESRYLQALGAVDSASAGDELLVLSGDSVELEFEPVPPVPTGQLLDTTWMLESTGGESGDDALSSVSGEYTLTLRDDGTFEAVGGCPPYEGRYEIGGGTVNIVESGIQGDFACLAYDPVQEHVMEVLQGSFHVEIDGDQLTVTNGEQMLVYRAAQAGE